MKTVNLLNLLSWPLVKGLVLAPLCKFPKK